MTKEFEINVTQPEALRRYVLGVGLIGAVLVSPAVPAWVALLGCYPIFTAMIQWDPVNALLQKVVCSFSKGVKDVVFRDSASTL